MIPRHHVIQRDGSKYPFWTGHDWAGAASEALRMTLGEAEDAITRLACESPHKLHLIKDYGTSSQCVLCTA